MKKILHQFVVCLILTAFVGTYQQHRSDYKPSLLSELIQDQPEKQPSQLEQ